jgi:predicted DNA-binding transcriptional regulator YafY
MTLNNLEEIERWVLGFGQNATVAKPQELKERVARAAKAVAERYGLRAQ